MNFSFFVFKIIFICNYCTNTQSYIFIFHVCLCILKNSLCYNLFLPFFIIVFISESFSFSAILIMLQEIWDLCDCNSNLYQSSFGTCVTLTWRHHILFFSFFHILMNYRNGSYDLDPSVESTYYFPPFLGQFLIKMPSMSDLSHIFCHLVVG